MRSALAHTRSQSQTRIYNGGMPIMKRTHFRTLPCFHCALQYPNVALILLYDKCFAVPLSAIVFSKHARARLPGYPIAGSK